MIEIKVRLAKTNPQFTSKDTERPYFYNRKYAKANNLSVQQTVTAIKNLWVENNFEAPIAGNFTEFDTLNAKLNIGFVDENVEKVKQKSYCVIEVNGFRRFYFITETKIGNNKGVTYNLELDTITTYLDLIMYNNKSALIRRKHDKRWVISNDKSKITPNFSQDSSLWNVDNETSKYSTIIKNKFPINVLSNMILPIPENPTNQKNVIYNNDITRNSFWPIVFMNGRNYNTESEQNPVTTPFNKLSDSYLTIMNILPYIGDNKLNLTSVNQYWKEYIIKVYASPLPFIPMKVNTDINPSHPYPVNEADTKHGKVASPTSFDYQGNTIDPQYNTFTKFAYNWNISTDILGLSIPTSSLSKIRNVKHEAKLKSSEHTYFLLRSINGNEFKIIPELLFGNDSLNLEIRQFLSSDGVYQSVEVISENTLYQKENEVNGRRFIIPYLDQFANASSKFADFIRDNGYQYKTSIQANKANTIVGAVSGVIQTATGIATGGISLAADKALGVAYGASNTASGATSIASSIVGGIYKNKALEAQATDLKKQGTTNEISNYALTKDLIVQDSSAFGDSKLLLLVEEHPDTHKQMIADYYNKFGYLSSRLMTFTDYTSFDGRKIFNYIEAPRISDGFDKSNLSPEIQSNIDGLFDLGVRLWTVDENGHLDNINDYSQENWEHEIVEAFPQTLQ